MSAGQETDFVSFAAACRQLGLEITEQQFATLLDYQALLTDWNTRINLVSRKDTARILVYHTIDSLAAARFIPQKSVCADIGTGAGLPGIPLAIIRSDLEMYLIESIKKKCRFLEQAITVLNLNRTKILCFRAEHLPALHCDVILSRLTSDLNRTLRNTFRHLKPGGILILYKSSNWSRELKTNIRLLERLKLQPATIERIKLPLTGIERYLVILVKQ